MLFKSKHRGFTLIELMVVIAIIGTLSTTVLAAVQDSRVRARDASLIRTALSLRNVIELARNEYGNYANTQNGSFWLGKTGVGSNSATCSEIPATVFPSATAYHTQLVDLCNGIVNTHSGSNDYLLILNNSISNQTSYSVRMLLVSGQWYCLGSSGRSTITTTYSATNPGCAGNP